MQIVFIIILKIVSLSGHCHPANYSNNFNKHEFDQQQQQQFLFAMISQRCNIHDYVNNKATVIDQLIHDNNHL